MNSLKFTYQSFINTIKTCSDIEIALSIIIVLFVLYSFQHLMTSIQNSTHVLSSNKEGMKGGKGRKSDTSLSMKYMKERYKVLKDTNTYDPFYVSIYDSIFSEPIRVEADVKSVLENTKMNEKSSLLDIGSGTGVHVRAFHEKFNKVKGVDKSEEMVTYAKDKFPYLDFVVGDAMKNTIFPSNSFSHITMFYFTCYMFHDFYGVLHNVYSWLKPGGYFVVHLVNRKMFDPLLSVSNPIRFVSPQKYAEKRITTSEIKFNDFKYKSEFKLDDVQNTAIFEETFKHDKTGNVRKHIHACTAPKLKIIIDTAQNIGFKVVKKVDLVKIEYEYQYLYILQK